MKNTMINHVHGWLTNHFKFRKIAALTLVLLANSSNLNAAVVWTFVETDFGDGTFSTTATASGSFAESYASTSTVNFTPGAFIRFDIFDVRVSGVGLVAEVGVASETGFLQSGTVDVSGNFGHNATGLFWSESDYGQTLSSGTEVFARATFPFSLAEMFDGPAPTADIVAWTSSSNSADTITYSFGSPVPEPSSALLVGLGGFSLLARRRRPS